MIQIEAREDLIAMVARDLKNYLTSLNLNANLLDKMFERADGPCVVQMKVLKNLERISTDMNQFVHEALDSNKLKHCLLTSDLG